MTRFYVQTSHDGVCGGAVWEEVDLCKFGEEKRLRNWSKSVGSSCRLKRSRTGFWKEPFCEIDFRVKKEIGEREGKIYNTGGIWNQFPN